VRYRTRIDPQM